MATSQELTVIDSSQVMTPWFELKKQLEKDIRDIPGDLFTSEDFKSEVLSRLKDLKCFKTGEFDLFQAKCAFWSSLLDQFLYLIELTEHLQSLEDGEEDENEWDEDPPTEEELFDFWNDSPYAESFSELIKDGDSPLSATHELQPLYEQQVLAFYDLHLDSRPTVEKTEGPFLYVANPDLGENENQLILGPKGHIFQNPEVFEEFPYINLYFYNSLDGVICYDQGKSQKSLSTLGTGLVVESPTQLRTFNLYQAFDYPSQNTAFSLENWKANLNNALEIIYQVSPRCSKAVDMLTNTLIAMDQPGIVSYSLKELPGVSHINAVERDFVDLMDDIVHENGHHYLNYHLLCEDLIYEDDEKIFYSAWREELRPIRGLFHAYCTFCWAHFLFADLTKFLLNEGKLPLTQDQETKIFRRLLEENTMLRCSEQEMERAYQLGKISEKGYEVYQMFKNQVSLSEDIVEKTRQVVSERDSSVTEKIKNLEKRLNEHMAEAQKH